MADFLCEVADRLRAAARDMLVKAHALDGKEYRVVQLVERKAPPFVIDLDDDEREVGPAAGEGKEIDHGR